MVDVNAECATCFFWEQGGRINQEHWAGQCRRYAPRPGDQREDEQTVRWPETRDNHWCGEWKEDP